MDAATLGLLVVLALAAAGALLLARSRRQRQRIIPLALGYDAAPRSIWNIHRTVEVRETRLKAHSLDEADRP